MLLAVDVGNTQTHLGVFERAELVERWRVATELEATADEVAMAMRGLLALRGMELDDVDACIVSSVVPHLSPEYRQMAERYLGLAAVIVGPGLKTGMSIRVDNPRELGADRLVNAVAGYERCHGPCVIVDFGTAITFDAVSASGEYLGGIIAPGVEISMEALTERAAALPKVDLHSPTALIGKTTQAAIQSGIVYGFAGQVDGIVERLRNELGEATTVIATGGLAAAIVPHTHTIDEVDDLLTLTGLRLVYERNR